MKYLSVDVETSGVDPLNNQILSIGIIIEDTEKKLSFEDVPKFHCAILHENISGNLFALNMNKELISLINLYNISKDDLREKIEEKNKMLFLKETEVAGAISGFLVKNGYDYTDGFIKFTAAGKNFGTFDKLFLENLPHWKHLFKVSHRNLDPSILFVDWKNDKEIPNLTTCKERAGTGDIVTHNAIEDAWDVVQLLRTQY